MTELLSSPTPSPENKSTLPSPHDSSVDFVLWEEELVGEQSNIAEVTTDTPPQRWGESKNDGTIEESEYNQRLRWRASNVGIALDIIRNQINDHKTAEVWFELKSAVMELIQSNYHSGKVTAIIELERAAYEFVHQFNFNADSYNSRRNK